MADNADARARGAIERIFAQAKKRDTIKGFVGKPNGNGTYTIYTGYAPGWVYVRLTDAVDGSIAIAIAMNTNLDPAVEVEMERVDGMLVIKSAVPAQAARLYGNSTPQAQQPPAQQPPAGYTNKAGGELSLVTKDGTALGGRVVRITPYRHRGGWWPGTDTITLTPTSTSGQRAWVLVGINTKTNAITQALSTNRSVGFTPFPESDVDAVINAYPDVDWRAAVNLANGETSIDATDILDLTNRGETKPKSNYTATAAPGVGDDIDDGYGVGSMWVDVTGDAVYFCVDSTAGAAVWHKLIIASGAISMSGDLNLNGNDLNNAATVLLNEGSAPSTPASGKVVVYAKADGLVYSKDDAGTETALGGSGSFSGDAFDVPYTPTDSGDWSSTPGDVGEALDTLAADVAAAGLSAAGTHWWPMAKPASPSTENDEFADASGGVPSGWTEVDHGSVTTVDEAVDGLRLTQSTHTGHSVAGIYKTIPAGDFTIWTRASIYAISTGASQLAIGGLCLYQDATSSTSDMFLFYTGLAASNVPEIAAFTITQYNGTGTGVVSASGNRSTVPPSVYLRIRRTSTTYHFDLSYDGVGAYRLYTTSSLGFTPTHYGLAVDNLNSGADIRGVFSFFRYTASDIGILAPWEGRRVNYYS